MSNMWYLIAETIADAVEERRERHREDWRDDRREGRERGPRIRERPGTFSGERIANNFLGRETAHDDLTDRGVRHAIYNLVGRKFFDRLFLGTVALLATLLFIHASGIFPWVGTTVFHNGPGTLLPDHRSSFGLNTLFVVKGQRLVIDYEVAIREGSGAERAIVANLEGAGFPKGLSHPVVVPQGAGRLSIPIEKTGFLYVKTPQWGKPRPDRHDSMLDSASVKWGLMWRDPGGSPRTVTPADIAATPKDWSTLATS